MKQNQTRWIFSFIHAIWLLVFTLFWRASSTTFADENFLLDWSAVINKTIFKLNANRPDSKEFVFVNVSEDKIAVMDDLGGRRILTDRESVGKLLNILNQYPNQYKFILCDILFDTRTEKDSLLKLEIEKTKNILIPSSVNINDTSNKAEYIRPIFEVASGLVDYNVTARKGIFNKYLLMEYDTLKSLPMLMYESLHQAHYKKRGMLYWMDNHLSYNLIAPDLRIRNYNLFEGNDYVSIKLYELLNLLQANQDKFFNEFLKNRIIVIGDFDNDKARTVFGDLAGSLILVNVYLALVNGENLVSYWMILLLLVSYTLISYSVFYSFRTKENVWFFKIRKNRFVLFFDYLIALLLITFVCYAISGIHINVGIIFIYLKAIDYVRNQSILAKTKKELLDAYKRSDELLLSILPKEVAEELKIKGKTTVKSYKLATVLFTDFKGFTDHASMMKAEDLVRELDFYFSKFDEIIEKYRLEKIKTIGDAYMCVGGVPEANQTNPIQAVLASLEIQYFINKIAKQKQEKGEYFWELRIGINSGELIAGVIGTNKFAYDVWGDAVNIASRMESNGLVNQINISTKTFQLIEPYFECAFRGEISVKGKGKMDAYLVNRLKPEFSKDETGTFPNEILLKKLEHLAHTTQSVDASLP